LQSGDTIEGFGVDELTCIAVARRRRWKAQGGDGSWNYYPWAWESYQKAVQEHGRAVSQTHVLIMPKGLELFDPFVLSLSGSGAMAFEGTKKMPGVLTRFSMTVLAASDVQTKPLRLPMRSFWLTFGAAVDGDGKPIFTKVGSGKQTANLVLPAPRGLPATAAECDPTQWLVDDSLFTHVEEIYKQAEDWMHAWDEMAETPASDKNGLHEEIEFMSDEERAAL
jgi:hypothetical protein